MHPAPRTIPAPRARHAPLSAAEHRRLRIRWVLQRNLTGWAFVAPVGVFFVLFLLIPVLGVFWWSAQSGRLLGGTEFVGLDNFVRIINSIEASGALRTTLMFALMSVPTIIVFAMVLGMSMARVQRGATVYRFFIYFPVLVPPIVVGLIWVFMTHADFGLLNLILRGVGMPPVNWLSASNALPIVAAADVWRSVGYWAIFFLAAFVGLPRELYEAAQLDGANSAKRFWHVTLPGIRNILLLAVLMSTIWALQVFDIILVLTRGGPGTATRSAVYYVWWYVFGDGQIGLGASISVLLLTVILGMTLLVIRLMRPKRG
ncbi:MAG: sugar ABC transporter permease [Chloroflexi bacterium]|nr:sugar ABC transporter permease [Chloroflexota bacterium]